MKVHGLTDEFLKDKPYFAGIADDLLKFFGDSQIIMHNVSFDLRMLNIELEKIQEPKIEKDRCFCTVTMARRVMPTKNTNGKKLLFSLNALCERLEIEKGDRGHKTDHDALKDAVLTAYVYQKLVATGTE